MKTILLAAEINKKARTIWAEIMDEEHGEVDDRGVFFKLVFKTRTYGFVPGRDCIVVGTQRLRVESVESDGESRFWTVSAGSLGDTYTNQFQNTGRGVT